MDRRRALAEALNARTSPGIRFYPVRFTPTASKYAGEECQGVFMIVTDRMALRPVRMGVEIAAMLRASCTGRQFELDGAERLFGSHDGIARIRAGDDPAAIAASWSAGEGRWRLLRAPYLLYAELSVIAPTPSSQAVVEVGRLPVRRESYNPTSARAGLAGEMCGSPHLKTPWIEAATLCGRSRLVLWLGCPWHPRIKVGPIGPAVITDRSPTRHSPVAGGARHFRPAAARFSSIGGASSSCSGPSDGGSPACRCCWRAGRTD